MMLEFWQFHAAGRWLSGRALFCPQQLGNRNSTFGKVETLNILTYLDQQKLFQLFENPAMIIDPRIR